MRRLAFASVLLACGPALKPPDNAGANGCAGLGADSCGRAKGMLAAADSYSTVRHEYILDPTSSFAPGRGLVQESGGFWSAIPTACAKPGSVLSTSGSSSSASTSSSGNNVSSGATPHVDAQTIDFGFIGVSVDNILVSADADITPYFSGGASGGVHKLRLVAIAFVRDIDPQFFDATGEITYSGQACTCRNATHFVGAVKMGGMLAYEMSIKEGEVHAKAMDFVKAKLSARDASVTETSVGGIEVEGLAEGLGSDDGGAPSVPKPLTFHVKNPVPIAYAVYPIGDVCKLAFPQPDVSPNVVDFGEAPYGVDATRMIHVVNRAPFELTGTLGKQTFAIGAHASTDVPVVWRPNPKDGSSIGRDKASGCDAQTREESITFTPKDGATPAVPQSQSVRLVESVRTGQDVYVRVEHIDTGEPRRSPDYKTTERDWTCPPDYTMQKCRTQAERCSDGSCSGGFSVTAKDDPNGCHFGCAGPSGITSLVTGGNFCQFDAVMECRLRCAH